jgi:hypothetical protein
MEGIRPMNGKECLEVIWNALHAYREDTIPEGMGDNDNKWNAICEAMSHLHETLNIDQSEID